MQKTLEEKIEEIFKQFAMEELGNRLSNFALVALKGFILKTIGESNGKTEEKPEV